MEPKRPSPRKIVGNSPALQASLRSAELIAATDVTTLICGETGTGKALFAEHIHRNSPRGQRPLITVNSAALTPESADIRLFGGPLQQADGSAYQRGELAQAHGGTLFIDEITEIPTSTQGKLLHFLESGEIPREGASTPQRYDVRLIVASSRVLADEVRSGRLRQDLYYRLNIVPLDLPALAQRNGDVPLLIEHFFRELVRELRLKPPEITDAARKLLCSYPWPGNVRELHNVCKRMLILSEGRPIDAENLPAEIRKQQRAGRSLFQLPAHGIALEDLEVDLYQQAIQTSRGNKTAAARLLGLSRDAFLYRLKKYGLR